MGSLLWKEPVALTLAAAIEKGRHYYDMVRKGGGNQSRWTPATDHKRKGWTMSNVRDGPWEPYREAYRDLSIPRDIELNRELHMDQDLGYENSLGEECEPTHGEFHGTYNLRGKTIISSNNYSPAGRLRKNLRVTKLDDQQTQRLPQLRQWSDLVWIAWASIPHYPAEATALKYIFKPDVVTPNTVAIIERVLRVEEGEFPEDGCEWPGIKFNPGEKEFFALLGTPHGCGVTYLLYDHPNEFHDKSVESINIFTTGYNSPTDWHLLFTLTGPGNEPLPKNDGEDDEDDGEDDSTILYPPQY